MNINPYGQTPSQHRVSTREKPFPGRGSQFKAPQRLPSSGRSQQLDQPGAFRGSGALRGGSQFKAPQRFLAGVPSGGWQQQSQRYAPPETPLSREIVPPHKIDQSYQIVPQQEGGNGQRGACAPFASYLAPIGEQATGPTMSLPDALALPPVVARTSYYGADSPPPQKHMLSVSPNTPGAGFSMGISASSTLREVQRRFSQDPRTLGRSWQPALPRVEARMRSEALRDAKTHVTIKVVLLGGSLVLMGVVISFVLVRFPTYLVVIWVILVIIYSNLVSRELRSYYQQTLTIRHPEAAHPSRITLPHEEDMGRHPMLKDMGDTTGYLKALCLVFNNDQSAQTYTSEVEAQR